MPDVHIPDFIPYVLAILGLLLLWEFHALQVRSGRIHAVDIWDRSGIRMFIYATPRDNRACPACREAHGHVFLPSLVAPKKFKALPSPCTNPSGCRCLLVGLYGGWPEAQALLGRLKSNSGKVRLPDEDIIELLKGRWQQAAGASVDQVSVPLLQALFDEGKDPEAAILGYHYVIEHARGERDFPFLIPSYFRLSDLLEHVGRPADALPIVERFLDRYDRTSPVAATESHLAIMKARQTRLTMMLKVQNYT
jgi:hypothetical protein